MSSSGAGDALATLHAGVTALAALDLAGLSQREQLDALVELHRLVNRVQAQQTRLIGAVHAGGAVAVEAATSTHAWLRARLRIGDATQQLSAASGLRRLPRVAAGYAEGAFGLEQVTAIAGGSGDLPDEALAAADTLLADLAGEFAPAALRRACARIRDHLDPDAADARHRHRHERRWLSVARTFEGRVALTGILDPAGGEQLLTALHAFNPPPTTDDTRTAAQRRADALVELCGHTTPSQPGQRPHLVVTVDLDDLRDTVPAPPLTADGRWTGPRFGSGHRLDPATLRRLACDATIIPAVLGGHGEPLDLGRARRLVSPTQRRALELRDGQCRFPGCDRPAGWCDAHHTTPWWAGGRTDLNELVLLCRFHHTTVHERHWTVAHDPKTGQVTAFDPTGRQHPLTSKPRSHSP